MQTSIDVHEHKESYSRSISSTSLEFSRVSDMIQRRSSLEDGSKSNGEVNASGSSNCMLKSTTSSNFEQSTTINMSQQGSSGSNSSSQMDCSSQESIASSSGGHSFIPTIKTMGTDGVSVLGVEFVNSSDPTQSASRCAAIKRPDKNRKVFQLGGIQNIFRDPARLPTVLCSCYGRDELCALCLGRAKKKAEINHVYMNSRDKLTVLDETFHKTLSFPEDVPLEALLTPISIGGASSSSIFPSGNSIQKLIKDRSHQFPPDFLDTGPRPKKPRSYDIKPYVESPVRSPKKDNRYGDEAPHSPRKRSAPRKSQSTYEERENLDFAGKGLMGRERKDSIRRTRNQEFDIDNIVIPYSMAATTRVEQLVYKPIETPSWRILEYTDIFTSSGDKSDGELEDMSTATFIHRHNKCEVEERKRFSQALQKAKNSTSSRKTRRLDSTCKSESFDASQTGDEAPSQSQTQSSEKGKESTDGSTTPQLTDNATVITEAMANQALKSLFKVGRRRTISTTSKVEEDEEPAVVVNYVDPWPGRSFPIPEVDYKDMVEEMHKCFPDCPVGLTSYDSHSIGSSSPTVF
ncbi:KAT8 regulatory NSL complex subunit 1 [Orchesella cincta]|uniref:KAT8 regulatory NSL complex subunit 1 n=1 Tax=Orchesella cincta TaxID=48709 RepID=A0A1D2NJN4_ORCCI|nr:KAT8 regulatory NSL complex subunit 1 [Orchesella cincta]